MWISAKLDQSSHIDQCFNELITECRLAGTQYLFYFIDFFSLFQF
jgi:hypothetical protein